MVGKMFGVYISANTKFYHQDSFNKYPNPWMLGDCEGFVINSTGILREVRNIFVNHLFPCYHLFTSFCCSFF